MLQLCSLASALTHRNSGFGERQQDCRRYQAQLSPSEFVQLDVTRTNIQACRVDAEQFPRHVALSRSELGTLMTTGAPLRASVRAGIGKK